MAKQLDGRVALITGGGQGVGQGVARALAEGGAHVMIGQRKINQGMAEAAHLRDAYGVKADFLATDVTDRAQVDALVAHTITIFGRLDILVNNAGGSIAKRLEKHSDDCPSSEHLAQLAA